MGRRPPDQRKGTVMRPVFSWRAGLLLALGAAAAWPWWAGGGVVPGTASGGESAPRPSPRVTISKETTFLTEPLTKDGYVDYLAALNGINSKGVTPENNAAVLLYRAFGPKDIPRQRREHVAMLLGIKPLPDDGEYLKDSSSFVRRKQPKEPPKPSPDGEQDPLRAAEAQFERARERPWSKDEFPLVAAWLAENEKPLEMIAAAAKRPRYFFPLFGSGESTMLIEVLLPTAQPAREAARALTARAMLRVKTGRIDEAWQDLLACHRLARLVGQGATLVEGLVGIAIEGNACHADAALAHYGGLSAERAKRCAEDLRQLPPMAKMVDKIAIGERFMYLDAVSMAARRGPSELMRLDGGAPANKGLAASLAKFASNALVNWDEPLRMGNARYDRLAEALSKPTRAERDAALANIEQDVQQTAQKVKDVRSFLGETVSSSPRRALGRQMGRIFVALMLPAIPAVARAEDRAAVYSSAGRVALALAAYRAEHGAYPTDLAQLCPKHLAALPEDPFSTGPLRYQRTQAGCVFYSVGLNGRDDGGLSRGTSDDASVPADADDVAIAMPRAEKR